jgi:hypothetical protein
VPLELRQGRDAILELPFPVVPEFRRDPAVAGEITGRHGDELFSVFFVVRKSKHFDWEEKVKVLKYRVNAGTSGCAAFVPVRHPART